MTQSCNDYFIVFRGWNLRLERLLISSNVLEILMNLLKGLQLFFFLKNSRRRIIWCTKKLFMQGLLVSVCWKIKMFAENKMIKSIDSQQFLLLPKLLIRNFFNNAIFTEYS